MLAHHLALALAALALPIVIAWQDFLVPSLRNNTISAGLYQKMADWRVLDLSYVALSTSLVLAFAGTGFWSTGLAVIAALSLLVVGASNSFSDFFDKFVDHSVVHSSATISVFISAFALQLVNDHGWLWAVSGLTAAFPLAAYLFFTYRPTVIQGVTVAPSPAAEKLFVSWLCCWLILV
ncbi:MAG TPA: hypothetical protein VN734_17345 [Acidobacteriaceae bacterium]|nr:hypothetical protein [Acidobacteriaceae bacterium]